VFWNYRIRRDLVARPSGRGQAMNGAEGEKERNREIAQNESERQTVSAVRLSSWAIAIAVVVCLIGFALGWAWLHR
jgi:F0F1-type ATP synthase assembly protein I